MIRLGLWVLREQITEVKCVLIILCQRNRLSRQLITIHVNFGHVAEVLFVSFPCCEVIFPMSILCVLFRKNPHFRRGLGLPSLMDGWLSVYISYLEFFCIGHFYSTQFTKSVCSHLFY